MPPQEKVAWYQKAQETYRPQTQEESADEKFGTKRPLHWTKVEDELEQGMLVKDKL
jgi:hypothetical protein